MPETQWLYCLVTWLEISAKTRAAVTRTQPINKSFRHPARRAELHSELSSSFIPTRSRKDQAGDGQMSAAIRPPLDICPDRIRLKQSPGPHVRDFVHACVAHWCAGCMPHAQCGGLRKIMALQMTFEMKCNTSTHTHTRTQTVAQCIFSPSESQQRLICLPFG